MPIQLGLCSSHGPSLFYNSFEGWERTHERLSKGRSQPSEVALETREVIEERIPAIKSNFATLKKQLADYDPDVLIMVIGDQREWFDASNIPNIMIYTGEDIWGVHNTSAMDQDPPLVPQDNLDQFKLDIKIDRSLADRLASGLIDKGFDIALSTKMNPQSQPKKGAPHGLAYLPPHIFPRKDLPVVPIFVMVDDGPPGILTGERCIELGRAIAQLCEDVPKRIAIYGSGGMSHNPGGPRAGWVDEPLDNWFIDQITSGTTNNLGALFSFPSETTVGGTGELRCWMTVAGAIEEIRPGHKAVKVDYIPTRKLTNGSGWVYWPAIDETPVSV